MAKPTKIKCVVCKGKDKQCPACKGTGKLNPPKVAAYKKDEDGSMKASAHALREHGYKLREIAEILGYKNPQSIVHLLNKE